MLLSLLVIIAFLVVLFLWFVLVVPSSPNRARNPGSVDFT